MNHSGGVNMNSNISNDDKEVLNDKKSNSLESIDHSEKDVKEIKILLIVLIVVIIVMVSFFWMIWPSIRTNPGTYDDYVDISEYRNDN